MSPSPFRTTPPRPLEQFDHDAVGNWLGNGRVHNELNQLIENNDYKYEYDLDGNMTLKVDKSTNDSTKFVWNIENKLIKVEKSGVVVEYVYGPLGRRLRKSVNGATKELRYDGEDLIIEMDDNDDIIAIYTFGPGIDQPLQMNRGGNNYYYLADGLGSIIAIADESGNILQEYKYSVFGEIVEQTSDSIPNTFTYTAREWEPEVGLYYYRARFYDPMIGRFISEDPLGLNTNDYSLYRYVSNSPINFIDPNGLKQCVPLPDRKEIIGRYVGYNYSWSGDHLNKPPHYHFTNISLGLKLGVGTEDATIFGYTIWILWRIESVTYKITKRELCCEFKCGLVDCNIVETGSRKEKGEHYFFVTWGISFAYPYYNE